MSSHDAHAPLIAEEELREALAHLVPDDAAFLEAARQRIAAAGGDPDAETEDDEPTGELHATLWDSPFLRRAAAVLPMGLLTKGAVPAAKFAGPKLGWKGFGVFLSFPVVSVIMLVITFLSAVGALRSTADGDALEPWEVQAEINLWWWGHWWQALLVVVGLTYLLTTQPLLAGAGILCVSMLALVLILRHLDRFGAVSAASVGRFTGSLLWGAALWVCLAYHPHPDILGGPVQHFGAVVILCLGAAVCSFADRKRAAWAMRERIRFGIAAVIFVGLAWTVLAQHRPSLERCLRTAEEFAEEPNHYQLDDWSFLVRSLREVQEFRGGDLDLSRQSARMEEEDAAESAPRWFARAGRRVHEAAQYAGIFPPGLLGIVCAEPESLVLRDLEQRVPSGLPDTYRIAALMQLDLLDEYRRGQLARNVLGKWPDAEENYCLEKMLHAVELLEALDHAAWIEKRRGEVETALRSHWTGSADEESSFATFAPRQDELEGDRYPSYYLRSAEAALHLMLRYGVPEGIEPERFARWLDQAATPHGAFQVVQSGRELETCRLAAAYYLLDAYLDAAGDPLPSRHRSLRRMADPVLLGALLLVTLCLQATLNAALAERRRNAKELRGRRDLG